MAKTTEPSKTLSPQKSRRTNKRRLLTILLPLVVLGVAGLAFLIYYLWWLRPINLIHLNVPSNVFSDGGNSGVLTDESRHSKSRLEDYQISEELLAQFENDFMPPYDISFVPPSSRPRLGLMLLMECVANEQYVRESSLPNLPEVIKEHLPIHTCRPDLITGFLPWGLSFSDYHMESTRQTASAIRTSIIQAPPERCRDPLLFFVSHFDISRTFIVSPQTPVPISERIYPSYSLQFWDPSMFDCRGYATWLYERLDSSNLYETISRDLWSILALRQSKKDRESEFASLHLDSWLEFLLEDPHQRYLCEVLSHTYFGKCTEEDFPDLFKAFLERPRSAVWFMLTRWSFHLVSCRMMSEMMMKFHLFTDDVLFPMAECYRDNLWDSVTLLDALPERVKEFWRDFPSRNSPVSIFVKNPLRWHSEQYHFLGARRMWSLKWFWYDAIRGEEWLTEERGELVINLPLAKYLGDLVRQSPTPSPPSEIIPPDPKVVDTVSESIRKLALELSTLNYQLISIEPIWLLFDLRKFARITNHEINLDIEYAKEAYQHYDSYLLFAVLSTRHPPDILGHWLHNLSQAHVTTMAFPLPLIFKCYQQLDLNGVQQALEYLTQDVNELDPSNTPEFIGQTLISSQCYQEAIQILLESDRPPENLPTATRSQRLIICFLLSQIVAFDKLKELKGLLPADFIIYEWQDRPIGLPLLARIPTEWPNLNRIQQLLVDRDFIDYEPYCFRWLTVQKIIEILRLNAEEQQQVLLLLDWYQQAWEEE